MRFGWLSRDESCVMVLLRLNRKGAVLKMKAADKHYRNSCLKDNLRSFLQWLLEWKVLSEACCTELAKSGILPDSYIVRQRVLCRSTYSRAGLR